VCASPPGQCFEPAGTCSAGTCNYPARRAGESCDDEDACTKGDACNGAGQCKHDTDVVCDAPPGDSHGSRQLPGNVRVPSDIATEPVTKTPPRPIQVPSDIATVSTLGQAPA